MSEPRMRPLLDSEWSSLSADPWVGKPIKVASTDLGSVANYIRVTADVTDPDNFQGFPIVPVEDGQLEVTLQNLTDGSLADPGQVGFSAWGTVAGGDVLSQFRRQTSRPPWLGTSDDLWFQAGHASNLWIGARESVTGYEYAIRVPLHWFGLDLAALLYAFVRFYSGAGVDGLDHLDRDALVIYSEGVTSYLRRRQLYTSRVVGESLLEQVKRLALESGAILRWGGFQDGATDVQQFGLGVLDWDFLRRVDTPLKSEGEDTVFLASSVAVRWTGQYIVTRQADRFGGGYTSLGGTQPTGALAFPFETRRQGENSQYRDYDLEAGNRLSYIDAAEEALGRTRKAERALPSMYRLESADNASPSRWAGLRRVVTWAMGPLHWDFDPGDIIHLEEPTVGLDGTEELLVLSKVIDWRTLHATIEALEVSVELPAMDPTDATVSSLCELWLLPDTGWTLSGSEITAWADQSGKGHDVDLRAPTLGPLKTTGANGIDGIPVADFEDAVTRGMRAAGAFNTGPYSGLTVIAVCRVDVSNPPMGVLFGADRDVGEEWAIMIRDDTGAGSVWGIDTGRAAFAAGFYTGLDPNTPPVGEWMILTAVVRLDDESNIIQGTGAEFDLMVGLDNRGGAVHIYEDQFDAQAYGIGYSHFEEDLSWPGRIAEIQAYSGVLRPHDIRRLHAGIRARYPGAGL